MIAMLIAATCELPPGRFDYPFAGRVIVHEGYGGELSAWDGPCFPFLGSAACSRRTLNDCHIWAMDRLSETCRRHEIAHCQQPPWPGDHPR